MYDRQFFFNLVMLKFVHIEIWFPTWNKAASKTQTFSKFLAEKEMAKFMQ